MLFAVSTSSTDIFNPDPKRNAVIEIHNSCSALLAIMTVITCPLETLCVFSSGGAEELIKDGHGTRTSWLSWLQPELFGEHNKRYDERIFLQETADRSRDISQQLIGEEPSLKIKNKALHIVFMCRLVTETEVTKKCSTI